MTLRSRMQSLRRLKARIPMKRFGTIALVFALLASASLAVGVVSIQRQRGDEELASPAAASGKRPKPRPTATPVATTPTPAPTPGPTSQPTPSPTPAPTPEPTSTPYPTVEPGYELAEPGDRTPPGPPSAERLELGASDGKPPVFSSYCDLSHSAPDDPIVFPRQPGASHLHDFFGNRATDAYSTDDSLRANLAETCTFQGDTAAYWVPALYENGVKIDPTLLAAYYTAEFKDYTKAEPFPKGLKMLVKDADAYSWWCLGNGTTTMYGSVPPRCRNGEHLELEIRFPDCWDGTYLDVPNHRSHMAYSSVGVCPVSHPVSVVQLKYFVVYEQARGGDIVLAPQSNPSSPHADFVNSWDQEALTIAVRDCVNAGAFCDGVLY